MSDLLHVPVTAPPTLSGIASWIRQASGVINRLITDSGSGGLADGNYGDVTVSGGGTAIDINPGAVSYADLPDVTASRLLGRGSASGAGDPQEIIIGANLTMTGTTLSAAGGGGGGTIADGNYGDVTVSGTGTAIDINAGVVGTPELANGGVTLAKQADVATGTLFYRKTAGTGSPEVQTLATLKADLGAAPSVANALTMNNGGAGAASGTTFDGSAARTLSYNTLGAAPTASPTFTGTVTMSGLVCTTVTASAGIKSVGYLSTGASLIRSEDTGAGAPPGSTGAGVEMHAGGIQAVNRTTLALAPLTVYGSTVTIGPVTSVLAVTTGAVSITGTLGVTGVASFAAGTKLSAYVSEKDFTLAFTAVANQKVQLYWPTGTRLQGRVEVTVAAGFEDQQASGFLKRTYAMHLTEGGSVVFQVSRDESEGGTYSLFTISDFRWDSTNSRWYVTICSLGAYANSVDVTIKTYAYPGGSSVWTNMAAVNVLASAPYTTDATVFASIAPGLKVTALNVVGKSSLGQSVSAGASANLPHGTAPSSPVNGDVWTTTAGIYVRINGITVGPLAAAPASGTSNPGSPATGDRFYRTDLKMEIVYDGTRWLTTEVYHVPLSAGDTLGPYSATTAGIRRAHVPFGGIYDFYLESVQTSTLLQSAASNANYMSIAVGSVVGVTTTNRATISTQNDALSTWLNHNALAINAVVSGAQLFEVGITEVGTVTAFYFVGEAVGRLVIP